MRFDPVEGRVSRWSPEGAYRVLNVEWHYQAGYLSEEDYREERTGLGDEHSWCIRDKKITCFLLYAPSASSLEDPGAREILDTEQKNLLH